MKTKTLSSPNLPTGILDTHTIQMWVWDGLYPKKKRIFCAYPKNSGVICFFDTLKEMRQWSDDVVEKRQMEDGVETTREKLYLCKLGVL